MKVKKRTILFIFLGLILLIVLGLFVYTKMNYNYVNINEENLGIKEELKNEEIKHVTTKINDMGEEYEEYTTTDISGIKNIALFGLDRRTSDESTTRSDSMIVATINFDTNEVKLTSFMRDMLVDIEGKGKDKLNHAYAYGGPELTIKTLNQNFDLNIEDYVSVDFLMLEDIIDIIGGVTIDVEEKEVPLINEYMLEVVKKNNLMDEYKPLDENIYGEIRLTGGQAVSFARIRAVGNGDYERTERQRIVLSAMIQELSGIKLTEVPSLAKAIFRNTETSIGELEALNMAKNYVLGDFSETQTSRIPRDGSFTTGTKRGMWIMDVDFEKEKEFLKGWVFNIETNEYFKSKEHKNLEEKEELILKEKKELSKNNPLHEINPIQ